MMQMIANHVDHNEYEHYLDEANLSVKELLALSSELYRLSTTRWNNQQASGNYGVNPFDVISLLEARVAILARTGDEGYADWMQDMWELAVGYSDQAGLSRKFNLFAELVASTKADLTREERSVLFYTRSLNRLAQLTDYWIGEDEARPLWNELMEYALTSMVGDEQHGALKVIKGNAPWFAKENEQH
ncbi:MAG: hypothetical protein VXV71_05925, partial [Candidatus Thermoplasmatota archaeon]|nr:hypothetical protein [Candidatus Thermoplasmatota archaeon]